jgi:hypothetical protein
LIYCAAAGPWSAAFFGGLEVVAIKLVADFYCYSFIAATFLLHPRGLYA